MTQQELFTGERLKDKGCVQVLDHNKLWQAEFDDSANRILRLYSFVTSEDVVIRIGPPPGHPSAVGAAMRSFAKRNKLVIDGYVKSEKPSCHSAIIARWRKP